MWKAATVAAEAHCEGGPLSLPRVTSHQWEETGRGTSKEILNTALVEVCLLFWQCVCQDGAISILAQANFQVI